MKESDFELSTEVLFRKTIHMSGSIILIINHFYGPRISQLFIVSLVIIYLISEYSRINGRSILGITWLTKIASSHEEQKSIVKTPLWFALGVFTTISLFPARYSLVGVLTLSIGDSIASIVGLSSKMNHNIPYNPKKTIEGTIAAIIITSIIANMFIDTTTSLIGCTIGMIVESLPIDINDNLTIPISSALAAYLYGLL